MRSVSNLRSDVLAEPDVGGAVTGRLNENYLTITVDGTRCRGDRACDITDPLHRLVFRRTVLV